MKIIILVLSYDDNDIYSKLYETQKKTWDSLSVDGVDTYYYFGNGDEDKIIGNTIITTIPEDLFNCGYKTIKAFELIQNLDFDFIFRTNSSSYVDKQRLLDYSLSLNNTNHYSGVIGFDSGVSFASGCGYFLSKDIMLKIIENKNNVNHSLNDDVSFGKILNDNNIFPQSNPRVDVNGNDISPDYFHYRVKSYDRNNDILKMFNIFELKNK